MNYRFPSLEHLSSKRSACISLVLVTSSSGLAFAQELKAPAGGKRLAVQQQKVSGLRGFDSVNAQGALWQTPTGKVSLVRFDCKGEATAKIVASKYLADVKAYGAVSEVAPAAGLNGTRFQVRHGGQWQIGVHRSQVYVAWAPTAQKLNEVARGWGASNWQKVPENAYPKFLDNFDNASLGLWWMPQNKPKDVMDFVKSTPAVFNIHEQRLGVSMAPGVDDTTGTRNTIAQAHLLNRPYRMMFWSDLPFWFQTAPTVDTVQNAPGATSRSLFEAGARYRTQVESPRATAVQQDVLGNTMRQFVDDPNLLAWMEPHGEFHMTDPLELPPEYQTRFPLYLQNERKYTLASISQAYTGNPSTYKSWAEVPYPDNAYFSGRVGDYLDLDDVKWRWHADKTANATVESGIAQSWNRRSFNDADWPLDYRDSAHMTAQVSRGDILPFWQRFEHDISAEWLRKANGKRIYLHLMPFTNWDGGQLSVWVNDKEVALKIKQPPGVYVNQHSQVDVTDVLKAGNNKFTIYSNGGHIKYRVFLSAEEGKEFPFQESALNQRYLDWRDYYRWEKLQTLTEYLRFMRSVDPNRPIKVMTPHLFQSAAMDLFKRYGAYPQLTGEGGWYRPMNYKGYARLHGLPGSSEGGGSFDDARQTQNGFGMMFWESQDIHDYVFDVERYLWPHKESVQWWRDNVPLLKTLGKTDFGPIRVGVLRDTEQEDRFKNDKIWLWDISRGPLPMAGISPVLIDGPEFAKGFGQNVPVIFDCATTVMTPEMVSAVERYVKNGGIFVAQHHTGQHTPSQRNAWVLPKAFGLSVEPRAVSEENFDNWPLAKLNFSTEQNLWPSLKGKSAEGSGVSIDWKGATHTGAVSVTADAKTTMQSIAKWADGSTAIADVHYGKGSFILLGTPFYTKFRDQNGVWLNDAQRQKLFEELLSSLKVELDTKSSDGQVWLEHRASKNGLYDVFIAGAIGVRNGDWKLTYAVPAALQVKLPQQTPLIEAQATGTPDVRASWHDGWSDLGKQDFSPYQIRQFAAVRPDAGLSGPMHWLQVQANQWRALEAVPASLAQQAPKRRETVAASLDMDGMDITSGWKVQVDPTRQDNDWIRPEFKDDAWRSAAVGSWLAQGFPQARQVRYRKQIQLPVKWRAAGQRLVLGLQGYWEFGVRDKGQIWLNGQLLERPASGPFELDISKQATNGTLNIAMQVEAGGLDRGPIGTMYLRCSALPTEILDLSGTWQRLESWEKKGDSVTLPANLKHVFGLKRTVEIPERWKGWRLQLVIDHAADSPKVTDGVIINERGYTRTDDMAWMPDGLRLDRWLKPGTNTLEIYGMGHMDSDYSGIDVNIRSIRLEAFPPGK